MNWPWQDRKGRFSWLKAATFGLLFVPAIWIVHQVANGQFGPVPLGGMTYWSGLWATRLLLLALAITPAVTMFRWGGLIVVRRMIGVTALVYTIAHIFIYFALRFWNFASIAHEMVTRVSLIIALAATIGLIALGATSLDAAIRWMGAGGWNRLHSIVYVVTSLALLHYLLSPDTYPEQFVTSGVFFWLMSWRALDQRRRSTDARALGALAVISGLFTALLEAGWLWAYQGYEPMGTFATDFSLDLGVPPAWQVLAMGLAATAAMLVCNLFRRDRIGPAPAGAWKP